MAETSTQGLLSTPKTLMLKEMLSTLEGMFYIQPVPEVAQSKLGTRMGLGTRLALHINYVPS